MPRRKGSGLGSTWSPKTRAVKRILDSKRWEVEHGELARIGRKVGLTRSGVFEIVKRRRKNSKKSRVTTKRERIEAELLKSNLGPREIMRIANLTKSSKSYVEGIAREMSRKGLVEKNYWLPASNLDSRESAIRRALLGAYRRNGNKFPYGAISRIAAEFTMLSVEISRIKTKMKKDGVLPKDADER